MARPADPQLRQRLLTATAAAFAAKGFSSATIDEITTRAGYSKASFYLHFDSKETAFRQLVTEHLAGLEAHIHDDDSFLTMQLGIEAGELVLHHLVDKQIRIVEYLWEHRTVARLLVSAPQSGDLRDLVDDVFERGRKRLERFIGWAICQGYFAPAIDPELASLLFAGAQERLVERIITSRTRPDIASMVRHAHELLLFGLVSEPLRSRLRPATTETPSS